MASAYARPDSTVSDTGWTTTGGAIYSVLDETSPSDSDYTSTAVSGGIGDETFEVGLSNVTDPASSTGHIIRVRHKWTGTLFAGTIIVDLVQGTTVKATFFPTPGGTFATSTYTLSGSEADSITDYTDLRIRVTFQPDIDDDLTAFVSWAEFEVPASAAYNETNWTHEQKVITVSGLGSGDAVRVRIKSVQNSGNLTSFLVHAFDGTGDPASGVTYNTSTDHYASQTPDAADRVNWEAVEVT